MNSLLIRKTYENHVCKFDIVTILQAILEFDMSFLHEVYTDIEDNMDIYMETYEDNHRSNLTAHVFLLCTSNKR